MRTNDLKQQRCRGRFIILFDKVEIKWGATLFDRIIMRCLIVLLWETPALARDPKQCSIGLLWWKSERNWLYIPVTDNPPAGDTEMEPRMAFA